MNKRFLALAAAVVMTFSAAGCSSDSSGSSSSSAAGASGKTDMFVSNKLFEQDYEGVNDIDEGPVLSIGKTKAKAGGIAEVKLYVDNAKNKWSMCALHITYPDVLECIKDENDEAKFSTGEALEKSIAAVTQVWDSNLPDDLKENKRFAAYITTIFDGNTGGDGEICTFYFKVPENAESGTVYDIDYYYSSNQYTKDVFSNDQEDAEMEKYAFSHCKSGSITVE